MKQVVFLLAVEISAIQRLSESDVLDSLDIEMTSLYFHWGGPEIICFPPGLSWGLLNWSGQILLPRDGPIPLQMHSMGHLTSTEQQEHSLCQPFPLHWAECAAETDCHFSPLSQKGWKIQMVLLRKAWLKFHVLFYSGGTKWNKITYKRWLYPVLLTGYKESVNTWNNSSDFEPMSKG